MLSHLQISNFTLVEQLEIELNEGLSVLTGETGAGKSILLDALSLVLGDRADADKVRHGADKADIQATFNLSKLPYVSKWVAEHELGDEDECLLRRVVTREGRSRAFVNGQSVTLQQLKTLGDMLVDLHGQHEHQSLLKLSTHQRLLDAFGGHRPLAKEVKRAFYHWHTASERLNFLQTQSDEINARFQLLSYQVDELNQLGLEEGELAKLESEQKQLANIETIKQNCQHIDEICSDDQSGLVTRLNAALRMLSSLESKSDTLKSAENLLEQALINVQEAQGDIERDLANEALDPSRLPEIEARLSTIYDIARKHRVSPEELTKLHENLGNELKQLQCSETQVEELEAEIAKHTEQYQTLADKLSAARNKSAVKLSKHINQKLAQLAMSHAKFEIGFKKTEQTKPQAQGHEETQFLISTTPGSPAKPLAKIASGGELSRISLAIQVTTAQTSTIPTLIFDEVDVGIGGTTGDTVGLLLRELGGKGQVLCVTHLAQVASKAHHHLRVEKTIDTNSVNSSLCVLSDSEKVKEIARMMGGSIDSDQSIAHAREMLEAV